MDQSDTALQVLAGNGAVREKNATELLVDGGAFCTYRAVVTNADRSRIGNIWAINDPRLDQSAFIENRGGAMRVDAILGNPALWHGVKRQWPEGVAEWPGGRDTRWIDNFGKLESIDNRFGGEGGGMCPVRHRGAGGSVAVRGGFARFAASATERALLYLEEPPSTVVLENVSGVPLSRSGSGRIHTRSGAGATGAVYAAGVLVPPAP